MNKFVRTALIALGAAVLPSLAAAAPEIASASSKPTVTRTSHKVMAKPHKTRIEHRAYKRTSKQRIHTKLGLHRLHRQEHPRV